jgi:hypothetical protein
MLLLLLLLKEIVILVVNREFYKQKKPGQRIKERREYNFGYISSM